MRGSGAGADGISDIPMQLLIGVCIISFASPIFISAYGDLSEELTDRSITDSIFMIMDAMEEVLSGERGSREIINIDLNGFGTCDLESLVIGGPIDDGSDTYLLMYSLSTGHSGRFSLDPPFPMAGENGESLVLGPGEYEISIMLDMDHILVSIQG